MRISVALATYQGERFLEQQLESIRNQSLLPSELVVGDDGSSDGTASVVAEFARGAPFPVSLQVHSTRVGSARNFESVIAECSGDAIALSDQDDLWQPTKLEALARALSAPSEPGLVFSDGELVDQHAVSLGISCWDSIGLSRQQRRAIDGDRAFPTFVRRQRRFGGTVPGATLAFRARYRPLVLPFPDFLPASAKGLLHDSWITLLVSAVAPVVSIPESLVLYRQHDAQQIGLAPRKPPASRPHVIRGPVSSEHSRWLSALCERLRARHDAFEGDDAVVVLEGWLRHLGVRSHLPRNRLRRAPTDRARARDRPLPCLLLRPAQRRPRPARLTGREDVDRAHGMVRGARLLDKPWLVVGKGPTFDRRGDFDLTQYHVISLNHVVEHIPVDVAHMIDVEVVRDCAAAILEHSRWLLVPRYPNRDSQPGTVAIEDYFDEIPALRDLERQGRLVWYNLARTPLVGRSPVIGAKYFSAEAVVAILSRLGVKTIRSLGVDGGRTYAVAFEDIAPSTLLANEQPAFDLQFRQIELITSEWGVDFRPLVEPFRIFIGTDETQVVAHRVLEYSIRRSSSIPVEVVPMLDFPTPLPENPAMRPRVPFSFSRFLIPKLCGFRGRALYLDSDMLVFGDVSELATLPFDGKSLLCTYQPEPPAQWRQKRDFFQTGRHTAVVLLDCAKLPWDADDIVGGLDDGRYTYEELVYGLAVVDDADIADTIPVEWNHLERYEPGVTKLLHYTVVPTQPWRTDANPLGELWMDAYREAVEAGAVPPEEVEALLAAGHVKPSLAAPLRRAPSRRAVLTDASLDLALARHRITELEAALTSMRRSWSWRIGDSIVRALRRPRDLLRRRMTTRRQPKR